METWGGGGEKEFGIVRSRVGFRVRDLGKDGYSADPGCWGEREVLLVWEYSESEM